MLIALVHHPWVVRREDHHTARFSDCAYRVDDEASVLPVELARWFVSKEYCCGSNQTPSDDDPLYFTAG